MMSKTPQTAVGGPMDARKNTPVSRHKKHPSHSCILPQFPRWAVGAGGDSLFFSTGSYFPRVENLLRRTEHIEINSFEARAIRPYRSWRQKVKIPTVKNQTRCRPRANNSFSEPHHLRRVFISFTGQTILPRAQR